MSWLVNPAAIPAADHVNDRLFSTTLTRVVDPLLPRVHRTQARKDITSPNDDIWNSLTIFLLPTILACVARVQRVSAVGRNYPSPNESR